MNSLLILAAASLSLASIVLWLRSVNRFNALLKYLLVVLMLTIMVSGFDSSTDGLKLTGFIISMLSAAWISSRLISHKMAHLIGLALLALFLFWKNYSVHFNEYPLLFDVKNVLLLPIIGASFPLIIRFKAGFLSRFFQLNQQAMQISLEVIGIGILALISLFFGSVYGLVLSGVGYLLTEWYDTQKSSSAGISLIVAGFATWMIPHFQIQAEPFLHGSTFIGLFTGIGLMFWINLSAQMEQLNIWKKLLYFLIIPLIIIAFVFIEKIKEHLGGFQALSAILLMLAAGGLWVHEKAIRVYLATISMGIALTLVFGDQFRSPVQEIKDDLFNQFEEVEASNEEKTTPVQNEMLSGDSLSPPIKKADDRLMGIWTVDTENSVLEFELGPPDARTKGAIKTLKGEFQFDTLVGKSKLEITMPLSGLTTFNDFRDESLMGAEFFDAQKFPDMFFKSVSLKQQGIKLLINGDFEMRGLKQRLKIPMNIIKKGQDTKGPYLLLKGNSVLDRTKHNMESDPKIGDLVEFSLKIKLRQ